MAKFRKKPVVIEAMQLPPDTRPKFRGGSDNEEFHRIGKEMHDKVEQVVLWMQEAGYKPRDDEYEFPEYGINFVTIETLEGELNAMAGDWIIRGVKGEFYPCKPDIFAETYELVQ